MIFYVLLFTIAIKYTNSLNNNLALTPPMGWLSWQTFKCNTDCINYPESCISENLIKSIADTMVNDGYLNLGYEYLIIDDCWMAHSRDYSNRLQPDPQRFPSGIKSLADYIHSRGLKFGIYADYGTYTCAGYPGSINHLELDAQTFAEWTVDYLKVDGCNSDTSSYDYGYPLFGYYLNQTNRPIVYSCSWPAYQLSEGELPNFNLISKYCNLWRSFGDIDNKVETVLGIGELVAKYQNILSQVQKPGSWNDPDQLVIGNPGLTIDDSKLQMSLWSILAAPLIISADLRTINVEFKDILQNKNLISINQDPLGIMGRKILTLNNNIDAWSKQLQYDKTAFVLVNLNPTYSIQSSVSLKQLNLDKYLAYNLFDSFTGKLIDNFSRDDFIKVNLGPYKSISFWSEPTFLRFKHKLNSFI